MKADAVFKGGGIKGRGLIGAVCCLEEKGYEWHRCAGYTGKELKDIMMNYDCKNYLDKYKN